MYEEKCYVSVFSFKKSFKNLCQKVCIHLDNIAFVVSSIMGKFFTKHLEIFSYSATH